MTLMALLSLAVGAAGGAAYGFVARRSHVALLNGGLRVSLAVRAGLIALRMLIMFAAMALVLWTGIFAPLLVGAGMAVGFALFNMVCSGARWM